MVSIIRSLVRFVNDLTPFTLVSVRMLSLSPVSWLAGNIDMKAIRASK